MRRRRPRGATGRPHPLERRFERRLEDLRAEYAAITASPDFVARIKSSLRRAGSPPPRRRKALSLCATLACAFLGGFLSGGAPGEVSRLAVVPPSSAGLHAPLRAAPRAGGPRVEAAAPAADPLPSWARALLRVDPDARVRATGEALEGVLGTSP